MMFNATLNYIVAVGLSSIGGGNRSTERTTDLPEVTGKLIT